MPSSSSPVGKRKNEGARVPVLDERLHHSQRSEDWLGIFLETSVMTLNSPAMVISLNLPRHPWLFCYNSTSWNPNTKFCLQMPNTSQQHDRKIHLQSRKEKVSRKQPVSFHQGKAPHQSPLGVYNLTYVGKPVKGKPGDNPRSSSQLKSRILSWIALQIKLIALSKINFKGNF